MKKYFIIAAVIGVALALAMGKMFLNHFEKSIRQDERRTIALQLEKDKLEKEGRITEDVAEKQIIIEKATPDELVEYFRTGKLPAKAGDHQNGAPKHSDRTAKPK